MGWNTRDLGGLEFYMDQLPDLGRWLEKQARRGWKPDLFFGRRRLVLTKGEPEELHYYATFADVDPRFYEEGEWRYLGTFGRLTLLVSKSGRGEPAGSWEGNPNVARYEGSKYVFLTGVLPLSGLLALLTAVFLILNEGPIWMTDRGRLLWSFQQLAAGILCLLSFTVLIRQSWWLVRNRRVVKDGRELSWNRLRLPQAAGYLVFVAVMMIGVSLCHGPDGEFFGLRYLVLVGVLWAINVGGLELAQRLRRRTKGRIPADASRVYAWMIGAMIAAAVLWIFCNSLLV